jgi:hypothetical protein
LQDVRPVEAHVWVLVLELANGVFVERGPPDLHMRRRAKPVQQVGAAGSLTLAGMQQVRAFVPAPITGKLEVRHVLLLAVTCVSRCAPLDAPQALPSGGERRLSLVPSTFST